MFAKTQFIRFLVAVLLCLCLGCGAVVAAFAEGPEETATTSTTVSEEAEESTEEETTSTVKEESSTTTTTKESTSEESTSRTEEESTTTTTTEPATEPEPEPEPDFAPDYTGIAKTTYEGELAWWRVVKGEIKPKATGVYKNENGWYYVKNGKVDWGHTGVEKNENGWWRIKNGRVDFGYTGIASNVNGWWRIVKGHVDFGYTGIAKNEYGWWRVVGGKVDFKATGVYKNEYGSWYVKNGKVDFSKTGTVLSGKTSYTVQKGKVTGVTMKVPLVNQKPNYPTGCEAASCTMLLKYYGYDITLAKMVNTIPRENLRTVDGKRYGPRITEKFVGDPRSSYTNANPGYGAFAPVVTKSLNNVIQNQHGKHKAVNKTGATFSELLSFLDEGKPVIVWSTYNMQTPKTVNAWYIATPTGSEYFSYPRGTHVCVLIGYDAKNIYLADPYGATNKTFSRSAFNDKYKLLGRQAVLLQ